MLQTHTFHHFLPITAQVHAWPGTRKWICWCTRSWTANISTSFCRFNRNGIHFQPKEAVTNQFLLNSPFLSLLSVFVNWLLAWWYWLKDIELFLPLQCWKNSQEITKQLQLLDSVSSFAIYATQSWKHTEHTHAHKLTEALVRFFL